MATFSPGSAFWLRIVAIATLVLGTPLALLKLPWLPATVQALMQTASESSANGAPAYVEDHAERLWRLVIALGLYALALFALFVLVKTALGLSRRLDAQVIGWLSALLVGAALPFFDAARIDRTTDRALFWLVMYVPIGIAALSFAALVIVSREALQHR